MIPLTLSGWGLPQVAYVSLYALSGVSAGQALASHIVSWVAILPVYAVGASILLAEALKGNKEGAKSDQ